MKHRVILSLCHSDTKPDLLDSLFKNPCLSKFCWFCNVFVPSNMEPLGH